MTIDAAGNIHDGTTGQFTGMVQREADCTQVLGPSPESHVATEVTVTRTYIDAGRVYAFVEFDPVDVEYNGRSIRLTSAWSYVANGPAGYVAGRGRIIKKGGTLGNRILETSSRQVPAEARAAIATLLRDVASS